MKTSARPLVLLAAALLPLLAACGEREPPERKAARLAAQREACIAEELFVKSREQMTTIDESGKARPADDPLAMITQAASQFARAYHARAAARFAELSYADSAARAGSRDDSVKYVRQAERVRPAPATAAGVDQNAAADYDREFTAARANLDHPCNQAMREAEAEGS